ncbi:MAG: glycoside hydrolase family 3 C-terminal domain-containing protein, partial [Lachnospiraceae bacterium]|nr:glycoside hydrolase family 3 C-terminal domain-containing protein [Lachnospiraceae bacterium]
MENKIFDTQLYAKTARAVVAEGIVMLRNESQILPLKKGEKIALFGRGQFNYYKSGTGSGGMVNTSYVVGIREALRQSSFVLNEELEKVYEDWLKDNPFDNGAGWGGEPWFQKEMPLTQELAARIRETSDTAVIVIARTAGEDQDNKPEAGSYLLTEGEEEMLRLVCSVFERTVVLLNVGNIIDMKWVERYQPAALLYVWQGGQEGGNGVLDVLEGKVSPSGKLTDTIAKDITDYPSTCNHGNRKKNIYQEDIYVGYRYFETFAKEKVLYPFGFGLSYTTFALETGQIEGGKKVLLFPVKVTNTGTCAGKEVVQIYCQAPQGALGKPARSLCGFAK